jgi:hypothetical protein
MGIFDKLFVAKKKSNGYMPTRKLNFQFDLIPENGSSLSEQFRNAVKSNENINLDFSEKTLEFVDTFLQKFKDEGMTVNDFAETIFVAGCYVGELFVKKNRATWIKQEEANLPNGITMMPIVIRLQNGTVTDPIAKAFKRFHNGNEDNLSFYYQVFASGKE